jgi:hypothetical protein
VDVVGDLERVPAPLGVAADGARIDAREAGHGDRLQTVVVAAERAELPLDLYFAARPVAPELQARIALRRATVQQPGGCPVADSALQRQHRARPRRHLVGYGTRGGRVWKVAAGAHRPILPCAGCIMT